MHTVKIGRNGRELSGVGLGGVGSISGGLSFPKINSARIHAVVCQGLG
jgi:hypothetical protein